MFKVDKVGEKMVGCFFEKGKGFETRETELPEPKEDEIVIRNMACGIYGTDVHIYVGGKGSADVPQSVILGHEYSGEIYKTGNGVTKFKPGDHVAVDPNIYCGQCYPCRNGKKQHCENLTAIGVNRNGGFAQFSVVPEKQAFLLNSDIDYEAGALVEPIACCIHGMDQAHIKSGDTVCIIGGGTIGLIMVQLARLNGAGTIILSEPVEMNRKIGLELGADLTVNPYAADIRTQIGELTGRNNVDVVIECVGKTVAVKQAFQIAGSGSTILLFSVPDPDAIFELPLYDVFKKELRIQGSFINPDTHQRAVNLINSKKIRTDLLITHRFRLDRLESAVQAQMGSDSIKVIIKPWM